MRKRWRFRIYEVEHQGDEQAAVEDLRKAGCDEIKVVCRDYLECECEESIMVECLLPEGMKSAEELGAFEICV